MFLVTGTGRSGSLYTARVLRAAGLDVGHEEAGKDGAVSSLWLHDVEWYPGYHSQNRPSFDYVLLQTRHPLDCIGSLTTTSRESWRWIDAHTPLGEIEFDSLIDKCAAWWVWQNMQARRVCRYSWRVETIEEHWGVLQSLLGFEAEFPSEIPKDVNSRPHVDVDLFSLSEEWVLSVLAWSTLYGYNLYGLGGRRWRPEWLLPRSLSH